MIFTVSEHIYAACDYCGGKDKTEKSIDFKYLAAAQ